MQAAKHIMSQARRLPLKGLLDSLEQSIVRLASPQKVAPRPKGPGARQPLKWNMPPPPPPPPGAKLKRIGSGVGFHSSRKHVCELYERYVTRGEVEEARRAAADHRITEAAEATARSKAVPEVGSFTEVLKLYYPHFSQRTLDEMVADAKEGMDAVDRRAFIARAKGNYADRLRLAFSQSDKDRSGGLSVDEFVGAVRATGAQPPGRSRSHPASHEEMTALFAAADADGNGTLDFDEFLEMVASQPWLVRAFDRVVERGVRRKLQMEEARLTTIFRHPVSPISRLVKTDEGRRFWPSLHDLRPVHEIGESLERGARKPL